MVVVTITVDTTKLKLDTGYFVDIDDDGLCLADNDPEVFIQQVLPEDEARAVCERQGVDFDEMYLHLKRYVAMKGNCESTDSDEHYSTECEGTEWDKVEWVVK